MKVHRDDHPEVLTLAEIKTQIALGTLTIQELLDIIDKYCRSKYYLSEDVLNFLEDYLGIEIRNKNKFYIRNEDEDEDEDEDSY